MGETVLVLMSLSVGWAQGIERAERLAELRGEVESLQHEVTMDKGDMRTRLSALEAARTNLELQLRQEELRSQQLTIQIDKERALASEEGTVNEVLAPAVSAGLEAIVPVIEGGIPYRVPERLAAVEQLKIGLQGGTLAAPRAASRLWSLYEDELRLGRENAIDRQTITLDGQQLLVDVARLGMVSLCFRTADGDHGWAERTSGGWAWVRAQTRAERQQIQQLFDALEKQIRVGWFEIPGNAISEVQ